MLIPNTGDINMNRNIKSKKSVIICIVLLLISSLNFLTIVSSAPIQDNNDGTWFDDFADSTGISKNVNCVVSNGNVKLGSGVSTFYYDFTATANKPEASWSNLSLMLTGEEPELILPRNLLLENSFDDSGINAIKYNDDKVELTRSTFINKPWYNRTFSPVHHFKFKINQNKDAVDEIKFSWWYEDYRSDANIQDISLYVWDYSYLVLDRWVQVDTKPYGTGSNFIVFTTNDTSYIGSDGYIDFLIVATPKTNGIATILTTDYLNLTISTLVGYFYEGHVTSVEIIPDPTKLSRWESIVWSGSGATNTSYVKIRILDDSGTVISGLPGNSDGFTTSPIDISALSGDNYKKIKLKASLHSDNLLLTPFLYSWGVTWQTQSNQFRDTFKTDLRIEKIIGAKIDSKIEMTDFYSSWPIFGKDPTNTRYYDGYGPQNSSVYWTTKNETVGGGTRSPVMSKGVIYVASSVENKIYAYSAPGKSDEKIPIDSSNSGYIVDSAVAVSDDYVIFGTSELNASNKIYALNKNDLTNEVWTYSFSGGDICFSSAPTIADDKIFITSWSGTYWDTPLLSILGKLIGGNNKLITLNLADGSKIWEKDYIDLPAGSFSTPAVADGKIFVGCDNLYGSNLFAFDEDTGEEIWSKKIGLIGGASPVVFDGKVFVVVKEQGPLSVKGDVKLFALYESNGTSIWNKTLAKNVPAFESIPKGLHFYNLASTSTPAINENTKRVFVTSPDGKLHAYGTDGTELWTTYLHSNIYGIIPTFSCTSPVATDDYIYVASTNGVVHALEASDGEESWKYSCKTENSQLLLANPYILAPPIVADGLIYVSVTEELNAFSGRIYSIGNYTVSKKASAISKPIHVPTGYWWQKVQVSKYNSTNSAIAFSILDEDYNAFLSDVKNNDIISDPSDINSNVIRLRADFSRKDKFQNPILYSWGVTWVLENKNPVFDESSFSPDPSGWINTKTPECSIRVYDVTGTGIVTSGLDIDSAEYKLEYVPTGSSTSVIKSFSAVSNDKNGVEETILIAPIPNLNINISEVRNITFSIKDLAGNKVTSSTKKFKMDTVKPTSQIEDIDDFSDKYNKPVTINAGASDDKSGVRSAALCYRVSADNKNWGDWKTFSSSVKPYVWLFDPTGDSYESGYYELCTIATDNATNKEDFPTSHSDDRILAFIYDTVDPYISTEIAGEYRYNDLPVFSIKFEDEFKLEKVEYMLNFNTNWTLIEDDIGGKSYTGDWSITQKEWEYMIEKEEYFLFFKLTDFCGNQYISSEDESLKIIKDLTTSRSYLDLSDFQEWHWDDKFIIATNLQNEKNITRMTLFYRYSPDNEDWSDWTQYGGYLTKLPFKWNFTASDGSGYYEFYTETRDSKGMIGHSEIESINVTLFPMTTVIVMIVLVILLILISSFVLVRLKKKKT